MECKLKNKQTNKSGPWPHSLKSTTSVHSMTFLAIFLLTFKDPGGTAAQQLPSETAVSNPNTLALLKFAWGSLNSLSTPSDTSQPLSSAHAFIPTTNKLPQASFGARLMEPLPPQSLYFRGVMTSPQLLPSGSHPSPSFQSLLSEKEAEIDLTAKDKDSVSLGKGSSCKISLLTVG